MANAVNDPTAAWKQVQGEGKEKEGGEERRRDGESKGREQEERRVMFINDETGVASWGSGNTNTNGFWWIASRPGTTGSTCANTPSNGPSIDSGTSFSLFLSLSPSLPLSSYHSFRSYPISFERNVLDYRGRQQRVHYWQSAKRCHPHFRSCCRYKERRARRDRETERDNEGEKRIRGMDGNLFCRRDHHSVQCHEAIRLHR